MHKESKHEGIRYLCKHSEYFANTPLSLKRHIIIKHNGIRSYLCDICEYSATRLTHLNRHIENQHEGIRYLCNQCEYSAYRPGIC